MLLSGDRESEVRYLAEAIGIGNVQFGKSPAEKVAIVEQETQESPTLFVGDGINDAPAMLVATAGVHPIGGVNAQEIISVIAVANALRVSVTRGPSRTWKAASPNRRR